MKNIAFLFLFIAVFVSCKRDLFPGPETELPAIIPYNPAEVLVTATLQGRVIDQQGKGMPNVTVRLGNLSQQTEFNGTFRFKQVEANQDGAFLHVDVTGYFPASKRVRITAGKENNVVLKLILGSPSGQVDAATGGTITTANGAKVKLPANSIVTADGSAYTGVVQVAIRWLDPTKYSTLADMPGSLMGIQDNAAEVALITHGMLGVELRSPSLQLLQLAKGAEAELTFPSSGQNALAEIDLWYLDETTGLWRNEGKAQLVNGSYVGKVAHFSFWNVDVPLNLVLIQGKVVTVEDAPMEGVQVRVTTLGLGCGYALTDADGGFSGYVPKDTPLFLSIGGGSCNSQSYGSDLGSLVGQTDLGDIAMTVSEINTVSGQVVDCDGSPLSDAFVMLAVDNGISSTYCDSNGYFDISYEDCGVAMANLSVYHFQNSLQNIPQIIQTDSQVDLGVLDACSEIVGGNTPVFYVQSDSFDFASNGMDTESLAYSYTYSGPGYIMGTNCDLEMSDNTGKSIHVSYQSEGLLTGLGHHTAIFSSITLSDGNKSYSINNAAFETVILTQDGNSGQQIAEIIVLTDVLVETTNDAGDPVTYLLDKLTISFVATRQN